MNPMDVQIGKLSATIAVTDDASVLHPAVADQLVERVMAKLREAERTRTRG
jgi:glyoxylate carboligase